MNYRAAWGAVGIVVVAALACVPDPAKKDNGGGGGAGGLISVTTGEGGDAGTSPSLAGTVGSAGDTSGDAGSTGSAGDTSGAAGDTSGAAGDTSGAAGDTSGAAGAVAGSNGGGGSATGGTVGAAGAGGAASGGAGGVGAGGGTAGSPPPVNACDRTSWTFTPSVVCTTACVGMADAQRLPANAIDGNVNTRWTTGIKQGSAGPENVVLAFPSPVSLTGISLYAKATTDPPFMYHVEYSTDGATFMDFAPVLTGAGTTTLLVSFPKTQMRTVRVTQTGMWPHWWSINEMTVVGCTSP